MLVNIRIPSALAGFLAAVATALMTASVSLTGVLTTQYCWTTFCLIPFVLGLIAALAVTFEGELHPTPCVTSSVWAMGFAALGLIIPAREGFVCLIMAAPIIVPLCLVGAFTGYWIRVFIRKQRDRSILCVSALIVAPLVMRHEASQPIQFVEHVETSRLIVNAPPEKVWPYVQHIPDLPPPTELLFRAGVAYPTKVDLSQPWVGGERHCRLSTGDMPEIVEVFQPNSELQFRVLDTPDSMRESSPYGPIRTDHLRGCFIARRGRIELKRLPGNRTELIGTSWYASRVGPDWYWKLWTDSVVEEVHLRVIREIKRHAEAAPAHP